MVEATRATSLSRKVLDRLDGVVGVGREGVRLYKLAADQDRARLAAPDDVCWEWLQPGETTRLLEIDEPPDDLDLRLSRRDTCLLASVGGRLAFYGWIQTTGIHPMTHAARQRAVLPGECWIYNCRTAEWARGRGIYPAALGRMLDEQFAGGCTTAWIYASDWNAPSLKGIEKAGFHLVETMRSVRIGSHYVRI